METLDYESLCNELICKLDSEKIVVLATSADNKVTARAMSPVNDGLKIMLQTGKNSEKAIQMSINPIVALSFSNVQIEAVASPLGHPLDKRNARFVELYRQKFPNYFEAYTAHSNEILYQFQISKATFYKYIDGNPCKEVIDVIENKAVRIQL